MKLVYAHSQARAKSSGSGGSKTSASHADVIVTSANFGGESNLLAAVLDGHGPEGAIAAAVAADCLPRAIAYNVLYQERSYVSLMETIFSDIHGLLSRSGLVDTSISGCTVCCALFPGMNQVVITNLGASRCLLGRLSCRAKSGVECVTLTRDHVADCPEEAERILRHGGRVAPYTHNGVSIGPQRVWLSDRQSPGLRVTRTLGDTDAHSVGVTCLPDVGVLSLQSYDRYLLLASDGLFAFMSDTECMDILHAAATTHNMCPRQAARHLIKEARKRWEAYEGSLLDDISCVVIYITHEPQAADGHASVKAKPALSKLGKLFKGWRR